MRMRELGSTLKFLGLLLFVTFGTASCVGVIEEGATPETKYTDPKLGGFNYNGIIAARAIAHDKIELEFEPLFDENQYNYFLHVNEDNPIKLSLESLRDGQVGYLKYTLKDLNINTLYKLRVSVEKLTGETSTRENEVYVKTFDNRVANFNGIVNVEAVPGQTHTSVKVSWVPSEIEGGILGLSHYDAKFYEVSYIPADSGLANINVAGAAGRESIRVEAKSASNNPNSVNITTLSPETTYYFQVRAIHKLYAEQELKNQQYGDPITVDREANTTWIKYTTSSANGLYDFDTDSVIVKNASGIAGLSTVNLFWSGADGIFQNYRIFYRKYVEGVDGPNAFLDESVFGRSEIQAYLNAGDAPDSHHGWKETATTETKVSISGLDSYAYYQFRVVPCRTATCKVDPATDSDASVVSDMVAIKVQPTLAPFYGINFINNPTDPNKTDEITIEFDPPALSLGYANKLKVYCLDPQMNSSVQFPEDNSKINSTVGNCDDLRYVEAINLNSTKKITIKGVKNVNTSTESEASYCFAMAPAIEGEGLETVDLDRSKWIVRCIAPEIKTPNLEEFPGINGSCEVNQDSAKVSWNTPTGGIYDKYRTFLLRKDSPSEKFNYAEMIDKAGTNNTKYKDVTTIASGSTETTFLNLESGKTYYVGVLAFTEGNAGYADDVYSEYNLGVVECNIPYPTASFDEWTRVFAIGPKVDGRVPTLGPNANFNSKSYIYEAINQEGIPYEVSRTGNYLSDFLINAAAGSNYVLSPGNFGSTFPTSFGNTLFDGKSNGGYAASRSGIVSLAWKDVSLDFKEAEFTAGQDYSLRATRTIGYRVYRSSDNKSTWKELTDDSGLIHAGVYKYRARSNSSLISDERMAFFTDYSVNSLEAGGANHNIDRARVYWYKIVPVYNGVELKYADSSSVKPRAEIKVTLPPANMALVHRKMANRNLCLEMGLSIDKDNNYECDYNGLGATAKTAPWRSDETVVDIKGDLLVDRFELGCNYTRGSDAASPKYENSYFNKGVAKSGLKSDLTEFTGFATDASFNDNTSKAFRGCTIGVESAWENKTLLSSLDDLDNNLSSDYDTKQFDKLIYGDCIYEGRSYLASQKCQSNDQATKRFRNYPGTPNSTFYPSEKADCSIVDTNSPTFSYGDDGSEPGLFDKEFIRNIAIQAEHMAVIFNRNLEESVITSPWGPSGEIVRVQGMGTSVLQNCFINLASIGADPGSGNAPWRSRWVSTNLLNRVKSSDDTGDHYVDNRSSIVGNTVDEVHGNSELYEASSSAEFRVPTSSLWNNQRFDSNTKVGRIFSSNAAKLPPLVGFSRQEANRLCETYEVQVGFSKDNTDFVAISAPKKKRLLRRQEFVATAAFPDGENYTEEKITDLESGDVSYNTNGRGSCVGNNRIDEKTFYSLDNSSNRTMSPNIPLANYLLTGSSSIDTSGSEQSEECVSRYGVQDLIGNISEVSSDALYCDYRLDTLYYGQDGVASASVTVDGYLDKTDFNSYIRSYPRDSNYTYWKEAKIYAMDGVTVLNADPIPWINRSSVSGYCSVVDNDSSRIANYTNFRDLSDIFRSVFDFGGNINTGLVKRVNYVDPAAIETVRSGDGYFLNAGPENLLPPLGEYTDTWALTSRGIANFDSDNQRIGHYFNPVLGLPLSCNASNVDTCGDIASDNKRITTAELPEDTAQNAPIPVIDDFPVHNSQIRHYSLGTSQGMLTSAWDTSLPEVYGDNTTQVILGYVMDATDASSLNQANVLNVLYKTPAQMIADGDVTAHLQTEKMEFDIPRHSLLQFNNGGDYSDNINGRYGMRLSYEIADQSGAVNEYYQKARSIGIRCAVKINE